MKRNHAIAAGALALVGCGATPPGPVTSVQDSAIGDGIMATVEADTVIASGRPKLTLACDRSSPPTVQFVLTETPASPPPLRGVMGSYSVDSGPWRTVELAWADGGIWQPREDQASGQEIAKAFLGGQVLSFRPPVGHSGGQVISWSTASFGAERDAITHWCSAAPAAA